MKKLAQQVFAGGGISQNNWLLGVLMIVLLINITISVLIVTQIQPVSAPVPIRYTTLTAFDRLGSWQELYVLPAASWIIFITNTLLAQITYRRSRITSFMLVLASLGMSLVALQILWLYIGVTHVAR